MLFKISNCFVAVILIMFFSGNKLFADVSVLPAKVDSRQIVIMPNGRDIIGLSEAMVLRYQDNYMLWMEIIKRNGDLAFGYTLSASGTIFENELVLPSINAPHPNYYVEPMVLPVGSKKGMVKYHLWFTGDKNNRIFHIESDKINEYLGKFHLVNFFRREKCLFFSYWHNLSRDKKFKLIHTAFVMEDKGKFIMYFSIERNSIYRAESKDGVNFYMDSNPVLSLGEPGAWDSEVVFDASVVKYKGYYIIFYSGAKEKHNKILSNIYIYYGIGAAVSRDGINFKKSRINPIILPEDSIDLGVGSPYVMGIKDSKYRIYFTGFSAESFRTIYVLDFDMEQLLLENKIQKGVE